METMNLWPQFEAPENRSPQNILREQAKALENVTGGILKGEVHTGVRSSSYYSEFITVPKHVDAIVKDEFPETINDKNLTTALYINSPRLSNYRFELLNIVHPLKIYPFILNDCVNNIKVEIENEEVFISTLKDLFNSKEVANVVISLMEQSRSL